MAKENLKNEIKKLGCSQLFIRLDINEHGFELKRESFDLEFLLNDAIRFLNMLSEIVKQDRKKSMQDEVKKDE